jgi:hypothetical protein
MPTDFVIAGMNPGRKLQDAKDCRIPIVCLADALLHSGALHVVTPNASLYNPTHPDDPPTLYDRITRRWSRVEDSPGCDGNGGECHPPPGVDSVRLDPLLGPNME